MAVFFSKKANFRLFYESLTLGDEESGVKEKNQQ
jgi:hypothetical protein